MRITNELKSYVIGKVAEIIPKPISETEANNVFEAAEKVRAEYRTFIEAHTEEFIKDHQSDPMLEGCLIEFSMPRYPTISVYVKDSPAVKQWDADKKEYDAFKIMAESKIFALLSVQKEVLDLDTFIANVIASIK